MAEIEVFKQIARDFADIADFITIYIREAHPADGWALGGNKYNFIQQNSLEERIEAAKVLQEYDFPCPILVDLMDDQNSQLYASLPERLYIIYNSVVEYMGVVGPRNYKPDEVKVWLEKHKKSQ